jgi:hypothetical protein
MKYTRHNHLERVSSVYPPSGNYSVSHLEFLARSVCERRYSEWQIEKRGLSFLAGTSTETQLNPNSSQGMDIIFSVMQFMRFYRLCLKSYNKHNNMIASIIYKFDVFKMHNQSKCQYT